MGVDALAQLDNALATRVDAFSWILSIEELAGGGEVGGRATTESSGVRQVLQKMAQR